MNDSKRRASHTKLKSEGSFRLSTTPSDLSQSLKSLGLRDDDDLESPKKRLGDSIASLNIDDILEKSPEKKPPPKPQTYQELYKTRYVTIGPNDNGRNAEKRKLHLPELSATDSAWLYAPDDDETSVCLTDQIGKGLNKGLEEKLIRDGYLETDVEQSEAEGDDNKPKSKKKKKKKGKGKSRGKIDNASDGLLLLGPKNKKGSTRLYDDYDSDDTLSLDSVQVKQVEQKSTQKEAKELYTLLKLNPQKRKSRRMYEDDKVRALIDDFPDLAQKRFGFRFFEGRRGRAIAPLSMLCALGATKTTIKKCYNAFPKALEKVDDGLGTPLHYACTYEPREKVVVFLASQSTNVTSKCDVEKRTPLHIAVICDASLSVIKKLVELGPEALLMQDEEGYTPLQLACMEESGVDVVELLATSNTKACTQKSHSGATALHLAIFYESPQEVIKALVDANPAALKAQDAKGRVALHVAVTIPDINVKLVTYLVNKYPKARKCKSKSGKTPFDAAKKTKAGPEILKLLTV